MPRLKDLIDKLHGSKVFSKIDLSTGYHQIQIRLGDDWKMTFKISKRLYEWYEMAFGLCNAPNIFMQLRNDILKLFLSIFLVYFNDI